MAKAFYLILLLSASILSYAQDATVKYSLTVEEQQQWAQFAQIEKARADALTQAANDLLNTAPGPDSVTVHARYQSAWLALSLVRSQRGEWLAKLQAARKCQDCVIDGKTLIPPKATE